MSRKIKIGSQFTGVGAFEYACYRVFGKENISNEYACDWDKFARKTYLHNHGEPKIYIKDVHDTPIDEIEQLDIFMSSFPCQSFSMAGKRLGKEDERGILFFQSHKFIEQNKPRFFILENVKGLLSDDKKNKKDAVGRTFMEICNMIGGKSVNGVPTIFPSEDSVPYNIYWKVLNSKKYGVPQNRERVFIVGIRDDQDNKFSWPKEEYLTKRLKDVLEIDVDEKYYLSDKMVNHLLNHDRAQEFITSETENVNCITANYSKQSSDLQYLKVSSDIEISKEEINQDIIVGTWRTHKDGEGFRETSDNNCPTIPARAREDGSGQPVICIPVLTPDRPEKRQNGRRFKEDGDPSFTLTAQDKHGIFDGYRIRRLTEREVFRLQDFDENFDFSVVSASQAYKQAGNSITIRVLEKIIEKLPI